MKYRVCVIDDDESILESIKLVLMGEGYEIFLYSNLAEAYCFIKKNSPDVLLLDVHFKDSNGIEFYKKLLSENITIPTIIISGAATAKEAALGIQLGVFDFIDKPISIDRLKITLQRCIEYDQQKKSIESLTIPASNSDETFIFNSSPMKEIKRIIHRFAAQDTKILITGETGVGKDVIASYIWRHSKRKDKPFITVNSAAIPNNLIESELFGYKKGSFTGAIFDRIGKIEMAHQGTLFLDEIGDLSLEAQAKLLRFLENDEIQRLGTHETKKVDARLIAATSKNLESEIEKSHFRLDLFYRLNVVRIEVPPLRNRVDDIVPLFNYFFNFFCLKNKLQKPPIEPSVYNVIQSYHWPGNVRELKNFAERILVMSEDKVTFQLVHRLMGGELFKNGFITKNENLIENIMPLKDFKNKVEKDYIKRILEKTNGSMTQAARLLQIDRSYLHQKIAKWKE